MEKTNLLKKFELKNMDEDKRNEIEKVKNEISLTDESIANFGRVEVNKISSFSSDVLKFIQLKDTPETEELVMELLENINSVDPTSLLQKKPSFLKKLFRVNDIENFTTKFNDVSTVISGIERKLETAQFTLKKDIEVCNNYLNINNEYITSLDNCIFAGQMKYEEEKAKLEEEKKSIDPTDLFEVEKLNTKEDILLRLERKIYDLMTMRAVAVQNIPQINLIKSGNHILVEKIDNSISYAIPLWESQMVIAISMLRQKGALQLSENVTKFTNKMIEKNSELLKENSIGVAKQMEEGLVDISTIEKTSKNLIETLKEIQKVRSDGEKNRQIATEKLIQIQNDLNQSLLNLNESSLNEHKRIA